MHVAAVADRTTVVADRRIAAAQLDHVVRLDAGVAKWTRLIEEADIARGDEHLRITNRRTIDGGIGLVVRKRDFVGERPRLVVPERAQIRERQRTRCERSCKAQLGDAAGLVRARAQYLVDRRQLERLFAGNDATGERARW